MTRKKSIIEQQNDRLIIWNYFSGPLFYFVGVIILFVIVGFLINFVWRSDSEFDDKKASEASDLKQQRIVQYIDYSKDILGTINKQYWDNGLYIIESEKGNFTIRFIDNDILNVEVTNKANQTVEIYRKK